MIARLVDLEGVTVAALPADVDAANAGRLREELASSVPHGSRDIVIDLRRTRYVDSAGIDMLFRLGQRLSERRAVLRIVIPSDSQLRRLAGLVGLDRGPAIYETLSGAVAAARNGHADAEDDQIRRDPKEPSGSAA